MRPSSNGVDRGGSMTNRQAVAAFLASVFLLALTGETRGEKVRVHIPTYSEAVIPLVVAQERGFYAQEGIEAVLIQARGSIGLKAMIVGEVDFTTAIGSALLGTVQGLPVKILMIADYRPMFWLFSQPELTSAEQLKGKRIAVSTLGSASDTLLRHVLRRRGVAAKDVVIIAIGAGTERFIALSTKTVEAAVLSAPSNLLAEKAGLRTLVSFGDEFETVKGGLAAPTRLLAEQPQRVQRFVRATIKGLKYFKANREGSILVMVKSMRIDEKTARTLYDLQIEAFTNDGLRGEAFMQTSIQMQLEQLGRKETIPTGAVFDFSFAKKANEN